MPTVVKWIYLRTRPPVAHELRELRCKARVVDAKDFRTIERLGYGFDIIRLDHFDFGTLPQESFGDDIVGGVHELRNANCHAWAYCLYRGIAVNFAILRLRKLSSPSREYQSPAVLRTRLGLLRHLLRRELSVPMMGRLSRSSIASLASRTLRAISSSNNFRPVSRYAV